MSKTELVMPKPVARSMVVVSCFASLGCGPGGFASAGDEFGDSDASDSSGGMSEPTDPSGSSDSSGSDTGGTDTGETDSGWTDETDTETDTDEPPPEPITGDCTRTWTHVDNQETHGHIGATPIGPGPAGGIVTVNPVLASADGVNVDSWIRRWSPGGELLWQETVSWADHRDDPLALVSDELGDVYMAGRINANTFEDAMIAKLDGESGELLWTTLRGEVGGYSELALQNGVVMVAGIIGGSSPRLELLALDPDSGAIEWSAEYPDVAQFAGLVVTDAQVYLLVPNAGTIELRRVSPPQTDSTVLATLDGELASDLALLGGSRLAALHHGGGGPAVSLVDRSSGELLATRIIDDFPGATMVSATELVALPGGSGLGVAGTVTLAGNERETFVLRLDSELEQHCVGQLGEADIGVFHSPDLRDLALGTDGELYTGSFVGPNRFSVFARWD